MSELTKKELKQIKRIVEAPGNYENSDLISALYSALDEANQTIANYEIEIGMKDNTINSFVASEAKLNATIQQRNARIEAQAEEISLLKHTYNQMFDEFAAEQSRCAKKDARIKLLAEKLEYSYQVCNCKRDNCKEIE